MRVPGTHPRNARPTIADATHSMPKRAPHARPRPQRRLSPICAQQHPLSPRIYPRNAWPNGVPVIQYRST